MTERLTCHKCGCILAPELMQAAGDQHECINRKRCERVQKQARHRKQVAGPAWAKRCKQVEIK